MPTIPEKPRRRRGRPSKQEEVRRALAEVGCNPDLIDPRRVLARIAADESMPPTARVQAARALLGLRDQEPAEDGGGDKINARAVAMMMRRAN